MYVERDDSNPHSALLLIKVLRDAARLDGLVAMNK